MPGPLTKTEQMVVGTLATLIALLAAYLFAMLGWFKPAKPLAVETGKDKES